MGIKKKLQTAVVKLTLRSETAALLREVKERAEASGHFFDLDEEINLALAAINLELDHESAEGREVSSEEL